MSQDGLTLEEANIITPRVQEKKKSRSINKNQTLPHEDDSRCQQLDLIDELKVIFF